MEISPLLATGTRIQYLHSKLKWFIDFNLYQDKKFAKNSSCEIYEAVNTEG